MSNLGDELILGRETGRAHDSDDDGVSDVQEGFDGTDPNDPNSLLRRVTTGIGSDDPRGHLDGPNGLGHEVIDVTTGMPAGKSIEQNLPTGLDGTAIPTTHNHYGNADADKMFGGRTGTDANSPLNMNRDPVSGNASTPGSPGAPGLGDTDRGVVVSADPASDSKSFSGNGYSTPPAGADLSFRAPNSGLVSGSKVGGKEIPEFKEGTQRPYNVEPPGKAEMQNFDKEPPTWWEQKLKEWNQITGGGTGDGLDNLGAAGDKKTMVDPDSGVGSAGTPSAEEIERALTVAGADTDFVEGHGGSQIQGDAPVLRHPIDLVTDGGADDPGAGTGTEAPGTLPADEISHPVNTLDPILGGPHPNPGGGGGNNGSGGNTGGNTGRAGADYSATAADVTGTPGADAVTGSGIGVVNIGGGSTGGIATVDDGDRATGIDDTTTDNTTAAADADADAVDDVPVDDVPVDDVPVDDGPVDDGPVDEMSVDALPAPLDPVADAMVIDPAPYEAPPAVFVVDEADGDLSMPDEPDLDDGF